MSESAYDIMRRKAQAYAKDLAPVVKACKAAGVVDLQGVLWIKSAIAGELEDGKECRTFRGADDTFGFTEPLVNRLMHAAYLQGARDIQEKSYKVGWDDAAAQAHKALQVAGLWRGDEE